MEKSSQNINRVKSSQPSNKESSSQNITNITREYFNSDNSTEDQASQRQSFNEAQGDPNNQPNQPIRPKYFNLDWVASENALQNQGLDHTETSSNSNNSIQLNLAPQFQPQDLMKQLKAVGRPPQEIATVYKYSELYMALENDNIEATKFLISNILSDKQLTPEEKIKQFTCYR